MSSALMLGSAARLHVDISGAYSVPRLDDLTRALWREVSGGDISDAESVALQSAIDARRGALSCAQQAGPVVSALSRKASLFKPRRHPVSPDREASIRRRRVLGSSSPLPAHFRGLFTEGQRAVMLIVASEVNAHGRCTLVVDKIGALAGVGRTSVHVALRRAQSLGLLKVTLRPQKGAKHLPNVIEILSSEWMAWIKRGPKRGSERPEAIGSAPLTHAKKVDPTKREETKRRAFGEASWRGRARSPSGDASDRGKEYRHEVSAYP